MAEFRSLMRNEFVKLRHGKFVWVMLVLMLVVSVGFSALVGIGMSMTDSEDYEKSYPLSEECDAELQYWEKYSSFAEEEDNIREEVLYYTTLKNLDLTRSDWRYQTGVVREFAHRSVQNLPGAGELEKIIRGNDYKGWYRWNIEETKLLYDGDETLGELFTTAERYCLEHDVVPSSDDWRYGIANVMENALFSVKDLEARRDAGMKINEKMLEEARNNYAVALYQLENEIPVNPGKSGSLLNTFLTAAIEGVENTSGSQLWTLLYTGVTLISIISFIGVVIAAGSVANEFQKGTIKFLLITPARRWKILLAKYCSVLAVTFTMTILLFLVNLLSAIVFCGGSHLFLPAISATNGVVHTSSPFLGVISQYLLELVQVVVSLTLAFAVSSLFRHSAAATAISLLLLYMGNFVNQLLALFGADWGRYLIFANMDLNSIRQGLNLYYRDQSLGVAIVVIVLHMIVFLLTAFDAFDRREV